MSNEIGPQYHKDHAFKAAARLHQSTFRAQVLGVPCADYGNRLTEPDGRRLLNYYDTLNVRQELRARFPRYSAMRDADMLRSEHIPFNMMAPLRLYPEVMERVLSAAFGVECSGPLELRLEWAPRPSERYLHDATSFDAYIQGRGQAGRRVGVGIEVKYTEGAYPIGKKEARYVADPMSPYWQVTQRSGQFIDDRSAALATDDLRQVWRNHLLGVAMIERGDIDEFVSVTLYPAGNTHISRVLSEYSDQLVPAARDRVRGCTFERFIGALSGDAAIIRWREYLAARYLVT